MVLYYALLVFVILRVLAAAFQEIFSQGRAAALLSVSVLFILEVTVVEHMNAAVTPPRGQGQGEKAALILQQMEPLGLGQ